MSSEIEGMSPGARRAAPQAMGDTAACPKVVRGDCVRLLSERPPASVDLIVMSAPAAARDGRGAGAIDPDGYVEWFLPRAAQMHRVLAARGSFILNIKEADFEGERHTYVLELILALKRQGWLWTEEYVWHKNYGDRRQEASGQRRGRRPANAGRLPDVWERCLHFTKQRSFKMNQDAVRVPMGEWAQSRLKSLGKSDSVRMNSAVGNSFGKRVSNWVGRELAYPTNVIHRTDADEPRTGTGLSASVACWFIELFSDRGDVVLDPFAVTSVTVDAATSLGRQGLGLAPRGARRSRSTAD